MWISDWNVHTDIADFRQFYLFFACNCYSLRSDHGSMLQSQDSFRSVFKARAASKGTCQISRVVVLEAWRKSIEDLRVDVLEVFAEDLGDNFVERECLVITFEVLIEKVSLFHHMIRH